MINSSRIYSGQPPDRPLYDYASRDQETHGVGFLKVEYKVQLAHLSSISLKLYHGLILYTLHMTEGTERKTHIPKITI